MDKMLQNEFYQCLADCQRVKIMDSYCNEHYLGKAKDIPANLKKYKIDAVVSVDDYLLIQITSIHGGKLK